MKKAVRAGFDILRGFHDRLPHDLATPQLIAILEVQGEPYS
jgi:hypothetical protein